MKFEITHSIAVCVASVALPFIMACGRQGDSLPDDAMEPAALFLNIEPVGQSRSATTDLTDNEKMHSVRVIVLHSDGSVEHNRLYRLDSPQENKYVLLNVTPDETKKIYLFANEESVSSVEGVVAGGGAGQTLTAFFDAYPEGTSGFADDADKLYFAPDYSNGKPIAMSSVYDIEFHGEGKIEPTLYVVRVATKFMLNFKNWRGEEVTVESFSIASHADRNFLMAHVLDTERNRQLFKGDTWIEWLRKVSEASSENDDYATTEAAGWLKDYKLPEAADKGCTYTCNTPITAGRPEVNIDNPDNSKPGTGDWIPVVYLPESISPKDGGADGEQQYTLTLKIAGRDEPFVCPLPNLKALFRNTCAVIDISLYNNREIEVDVIPYSEVTLDPIFGLPAKEEGT